MNPSINILKNTRGLVLELINGIPLSALNQVPAGFNNNIIWNAAHIVAAQQGICYLRSGNQAVVDEMFISHYKAGTKPDQFLGEEQVAEIKAILISTINQLETDYSNQMFNQYTAWTTRAGIEITSIDEAINFLVFHEGIHTGYIMALKKIVNHPDR